MRFVKLNKYIFDNEPLDYLMKLNAHCVHKDYLQYLINKKIVPINSLSPLTAQNHKIGIIIPNYNYGEWLENCLKSIMIQSYTNFEVIFIDDMSTDNSIEIAKMYIDKINIKIVELKQKRYSGGARNEG